VCHVISGYLRDDARVFYRQCISLSKNGHEVIVLTNDSEPDCETENVWFRACEHYWPSRLKVILFAKRQFLSKALEIDADIYQLHSPELLTLIPALKKRNKRIIYDAHEDMPRHIIEKDSIPWFARSILARIIDLYMKRAFSHVDSVISPHQHVVQELSGVVTNCVEIANFPLVEEKEKLVKNDFLNRETVFCYAGTVYPYSNQELTMAAISNIGSAKYVVAGHIDDAHLKELSICSGSEQSKFLGRISKTELGCVLDSAIAGLVVYDYKLNLGGKLGSFGTNKLFEYMEAGLPVICTDYEIWRSVVEGEGCGICIEPGNFDQLYQALLKLAENKDLAYEMGCRGRAAVERFYNWGSEEAKYLSLVDKL
jgi:glycosyltransferase involved in cell wall biosynthesis